MSDGQNEVRAINWQEVFAFSHVFKSFRMAIHPSKLLLALAAVTIIFLGGHVMDWIWSIGHASVPVGAIESRRTESVGYNDRVRAWKANKPDRAVELYRVANGTTVVDQARTPLSGAFLTAFETQTRDIKAIDLPPGIQADAERKPWATLRDAREAMQNRAAAVNAAIDRAYEETSKNISQPDSLEKIETQRSNAHQAVFEFKRTFNAEALNRVEGRGIFAELLEHTRSSFTGATMALLRGNILGGLREYQNAQRANDGGVVYNLLLMGEGFCWLLREHWIFAAIFLLLSLAVWSLLGGAIHRIAALQAAREEKISIRQALTFSINKFFSFFTAPLIPLVLILLAGGAVALGSLITGNLWGVGAILIGLLLLIALIAGLVMAFLIIGLGAGSGLMYPTVAVEGSDSFDAISRSFSYIFARPWRTGLYALAALVHGSICYLFVRFFAFLLLWSSHLFVKAGVFYGGEGLPGASDRIDAMWPKPTFDSLASPGITEAMSSMERIGAFLVSVWVYLVVAGVVAFVLSYAASATTVIYYLLRRKVDATDLDDVYVESGEDAEEELPAIEPVAEAPAPEAAAAPAETPPPPEGQPAPPEEPKA
ncbi:MAG: hypothetical protein ABFD92_10850 [Planctomycetaceae bacterium]|nr:hypothetical protein [Planctomycetaceae bacterium]